MNEADLRGLLLAISQQALTIRQLTLRVAELLAELEKHREK